MRPAEPSTLPAAAIALAAAFAAVLAAPARDAAAQSVLGWGYTGFSGIDDLSLVSAAAGGDDHTVVLTLHGTVGCWGRNTHGQCTVPAGLGRVIAIAAGGNHTLCVRDDGTVVGWGDNRQGQCEVPRGLGRVTAVAAGHAHSVALGSNGAVVCWGDGTLGQCGTPDAGPPMGPSVAVAAGRSHTMALGDDGRVTCWGDTAWGQCAPPDGLGFVTAIAAGGVHSMALRDDGTVACWGANDFRECEVPAQLRGVTAIAAGWGHSVALLGSGRVVAWGRNHFRQLDGPRGDGGPDLPPGYAYGSEEPSAGRENKRRTRFTAIAAGSMHTIAVRDDGRAIAWGDDTCGQSTVPPGVGAVVELASGSFLSVARRGDGAVLFWGRQTAGRFAPPRSPNPSGLRDAIAVGAGPHSAAVLTEEGVAEWAPTRDAVARASWWPLSAVAIARGGLHTVALTADGRVWWRTLSMAERTPPPEALRQGQRTVVAVACGEMHSSALCTDGAVVCWGSNDAGQCDVPNSVGRAMAIACGWDHSIALRVDGTVACWGSDRYGQCRVPEALPTVSEIAGGGMHTVALTTAGRVVCWGSDSHGQCGVPEAVNRGEHGRVLAISAGGFHTAVRLCTAPMVSRGTGDLGPVGFGVPREHTFGDLPAPGGDAVVTVRVRGDLRRNFEYLRLMANGVVLAERIFVLGARDCPPTPDAADIVVRAADLAALLVDGTLTLRLDATRQTGAEECPDAMCEVHIRYRAAGDGCGE